MKQSLFFVFAIIMSFTACRKEIDELKTYAVTVQAKYPSTFSSQLALDATVTLTNIADGSIKTSTTNASGDAVFKDVLPGTYSIAANKSLSAADALSLTGISNSVQLNGAKNDVLISQAETFQLQLQGSAIGGLVIKEVYYTASKTPSGGNYFSDQFVEIYNNATDTLYLDSLCIADIHGNSGLINPTSLPTPFNTDNGNVYANSIWQIPGTGKQYPLAPGQSIVIAQDGVNHKDASLNPSSPVDLSAANWETYNERPDGRDADAPQVPNLRRVYFTGGFDWLLTVFGPGVIIYKADFTKLEQVAIPGASSTTPPRIKVPNGVIIDGFEALRDGNSASFKRVTTAVDAGFVFADNTYNMQSFRRKVTTIINGRRVLQDTNNSTNDFEKIASPTPKGF
ncbi:MAG: DUF4876 domain-containing protein [Cytophagales bacterium]|jgi:hypothetical protein|nr:DUF4876 domain-containing protein [Cytophagales bacterium]MCA6386465.1 DUF4876 domain-containing protein [Cytophagales bacterium]MCA6390025.1 DUF4876 domain-containing protein [Cytophagales bacterium]MCA6395158.1 DUF4876 domain-containing protein [Cytophagales bacterium]MCA6398185.1 DUF4876 domain-containing protein [Cytophagales bacterium]